MPVVNPPEVWPETMRLITRLLLAQDNQLASDTIENLIAPAGLGGAVKVGSGDREDGHRVIQRTISAMQSIGMLEDKKGNISLSSEVTEEFKSWKEVTQPRFSHLFRSQYLSKESTDPTDNTGAIDLSRVLALLLAIPEPLKPIVGYDDPSPNDRKFVNDFQYRYLKKGSQSPVVNTERWQGIRRWVLYLGFARPDPTSSSAVLIDASNAIGPHVAELVKGEQLVSHFLVDLGKVLQFTDRGTVGTTMRQQFKEPPGDRNLSPGLALALQLLDQKGVINLVNKDDAESLEFPIEPGGPVRFSHIGPG